MFHLNAGLMSDAIDKDQSPVNLQNIMFQAY